MTRPRSSSGTSKTATSPPVSSTPTSPKNKYEPTSPPSTKPSRSSVKSLVIQGQQRRIFLHHLTQWSLNHDSSPHFQGKISLLPQSVKGADVLELGKTITCILTDTTFTDSRQRIIIKLFPPQEYKKNCHGGEDRNPRRDSMDPVACEATRQQHAMDIRESGGELEQMYPGGAKGHYKLVVRCGAGWMSARDYFSKLYFSHLEARQANRKERLTLDEYLMKRSQALGLPPSEKDSITIRPLFHHFNRLPPELQEMVLMKAAGLSRSYNLCSDDYGTLKMKKDDCRSAISLSTLFRVSKGMNNHLIPYIYHSTDFHFGLTGFTNFLWQSGPTNRRDIRRLTFHFGKLALLHCIRWLAPDNIFSLFEPPVATNPRSLQYFWRCQIQDLVKDLHLFTLTINIKQIPAVDIPMIVAIMTNAFGSVERIQFVETGNNGATSTVSIKDERLSGLTKMSTWRDLCLDYYQTHRLHSYFFKFELLKGRAEDLESVMNGDEKFFDTAFSPISLRKGDTA